MTVWSAPAVLLMTFILLGGVAACLIPRFKPKALGGRRAGAQRLRQSEAGGEVHPRTGRAAHTRRPSWWPGPAARHRRPYDWSIDGECRPPYPHWTMGEHCEACGAEGVVYVHSRCHPTEPTWAVLHGDRVRIECSECEREIVTFERVMP